MSPRRVIFLGLTALFLVLCADTAPSAEEAPQYEAHITYLTTKSVYVDAGTDAGLKVGQVLDVVRDGSVIAHLRVVSLSSRKALCEIVDTAGALQVNDNVIFVPEASPDPTEKTRPPAADVEPSRGRSGSGLHGSVGLRYLSVSDALFEGNDYSQPAIDVRVAGTRIGGAPIDLNIDVRSRRTYLPEADADSTTLVYRAAVAWQEPGSPWRVTLGRQVSPSLAVVNIFDGIEGSYQSRRWGAGVFTGTQPDIESFGYSSRIREHGAYFGWRNAPGSNRRWTFTTGFVGSYDDGEINREFTYLQGTYGGPRLSLYIVEEIDFNRGWKEVAEEEKVSVTSTYFSARYRLTENWSLGGGYDNRRNVRLYRDRVTPLTQFNDQYRTGGWLGTTVRFKRRYSVGLDLRTRGGGGLGSADGMTIRFGANQLTPLRFDVSVRSSYYENDRVEGWFHSGAIGLPLGSRWRVGLQGGVRDETNLIDSQFDDQLVWYGANVDVYMGRHWFLLVSYEETESSIEASSQVYSSLTYRF